MSRCQCQAGFFVLRACGNPAVLTCSACGRAICHAHTAAALPAPRCYDCRARRQQDQDADPPDTDEEVDTSSFDDAWVYSERDRYHAGSRYDARDAGAFVAADRELDDLDAGQGGFGDS